MLLRTPPSKRYLSLSTSRLLPLPPWSPSFARIARRNSLSYISCASTHSTKKSVLTATGKWTSSSSLNRPFIRSFFIFPLSLLYIIYIGFPTYSLSYILTPLYKVPPTFLPGKIKNLDFQRFSRARGTITRKKRKNCRKSEKRRDTGRRREAPRKMWGTEGQQGRKIEVGEYGMPWKYYTSRYFC